VQQQQQQQQQQAAAAAAAGVRGRMASAPGVPRSSFDATTDDDDRGDDGADEKEDATEETDTDDADDAEILAARRGALRLPITHSSGSTVGSAGGSTSIPAAVHAHARGRASMPAPSSTAGAGAGVGAGAGAGDGLTPLQRRESYDARVRADEEARRLRHNFTREAADRLRASVAAHAAAGAGKPPLPGQTTPQQKQLQLQLQQQGAYGSVDIITEPDD
jgi:hypothetical protein